MNYFPTEKDAIYQLLLNIEPERYSETRNYISGAVTYLSPYISRGVFSTRDVFEHLKRSGFSWEIVEKLVQELAWRDFFQLTWQRLGESIDKDIMNEQEQVSNFGIPEALLNNRTGIVGIDESLQKLFNIGYMHNHARMYVASLACNLARSYWLEPARWMNYHLLDADWASNACSWQWVAGTFSKKKYFFNQENINRYCETNQSATFLDVSYEELPYLEIPDILNETRHVQLKTQLPDVAENIVINPEIPTLIYNWYNLDFNWRAEEQANRVLLLEPDIFEKYPIGQKSVQFMLELIKNRSDIQIFVGSFGEFKFKSGDSKFIFKEHPLNKYEGVEEPREFLCATPEKSLVSFFGFWKAIKTQLKADFENN